MQVSPFLMCLDFGVCAPQSALFALATTHSPNVSLNASRPYSVPLCAVLEGTHGTAPQGATLGLRIDKYRALIMSRALCAASQQHGAVACTIRRP